MDATNKITGIIFELDKAKFEEKIKKGIASNIASKQSTQSIMIYREDANNNEYIDMQNYSDDAKVTAITKTLVKAQQEGLAQSEVTTYYSGNPILVDAKNRAQGHKLYLPTAEREEEVQRIVEEETKKSKKTGVKVTVAALTLAVIAGLAAYGIHKEKNNDQEVIEQQIEIDNWENYFINAAETAQKELFVNSVADWTTNLNAAEAWEKVTLTDEEMKELGYETPECVFGFTAEDAYSLALRYNTYTKDELVTISGGKEFDVTSLISSSDSLSNKALTKIQTYYFNSRDCDLNIDKVIKFTEAGNDKIKELESLFREYKILARYDEMEDKAEATMKEIKHVILECAYDTTFDKDAKSYILSTFLPTASRISEMHQYKDKIEIELYDTKKDVNVTKEIKTSLFDEITNRALRLGFKATENVGSFDAESFLENHNIDAKRYNLLNVDVERSITDQLYSEQVTKLEEANQYIASLRSEDHTSEVAYAGAKGIDLTNTNSNELNNVESTYDTLVKGTYDSDEIIDMLNAYLNEKGIYPTNIDYFSTTSISKQIEEYKNTHGITAGKPGDTIRGETTHKKVTASDLSSGVVKNDAGETISAEQAMKDAREENEQQTGIYDGSTPEAEKDAEEKVENSDDYKNRTALLQGVYDATYNHFYGKNVISTSYGYDSSWANSSDSEIKNRHDTAKSQALSRLAQEEAAEKANEESKNQDPVIDEEFKDAETSDKPVQPVVTPEPVVPTPAPQPEPTPAPKEEVVDKDDIIPDEGFEDVEYEGDLIVGQSTNTPISNQAPAGLAPVVEVAGNNSTADNGYITIEEIESFIENMSDEQWQTFVETGEIQSAKTK